jgi:hypothetical protein
MEISDHACKYKILSLLCLLLMNIIDVLQSGYLNKLARQSGRNWKKRYFVLTPYYLQYFDNEKNLSSPKGEIVFNKGVKVLTDTTVPSGFGFRIITAEEQVVVSADKQTDQTLWIAKLTSVIEFLKSAVLMDPLIELVSGGKVDLSVDDLRNKDLDKLETQKIFILTENFLSIHSNSKALSMIDKVIELKASTIMKKKLHVKTIFDIKDANNVGVVIIFPDSTSKGKVRLEEWKAKLRGCITVIEDSDRQITTKDGQTIGTISTSLLPTNRASVGKSIAQVMVEFQKDIFLKQSNNTWNYKSLHVSWITWILCDVNNLILY